MKLSKGIYAPVMWIALFVAVATAPLWVPALSDAPRDAAAVRVADAAVHGGR